MTRGNRKRIATGLAVAAAGLASVGAAPAGAATTHWICRPGLASTPCTESLRTTVVSATGRSRVSAPTIPRRPRFDCFYVYPTTSDEKQAQADFRVTPELKAIARNQALPYAQACRVFVPVYRQVTVQGLFNPTTITDTMREQGYQDVVAAWQDFLQNYSKGRPFMLIGHSQGTFVLRRLISTLIDPDPGLRKRLVAAHLTGGNVLVAKGRDLGGDFQNIPACRTADQTGCVVAYSAFNAPVPDGSRFGRPAATPWAPAADPSQQEVLCTNPASLSGGPGDLSTLNNRKKFPGTIGLAIALLGRVLPRASTDWVSQPYLYRASCTTSNGANVLMVSSRTSAKALSPSPDATWGLHIGDMNIALGNLVALAKRQGAAWQP